MAIATLSFRNLLTGAVVAASTALPVQAGADTLRAVPHAQLEVLDPIWTTAYITRSHGYLVYDMLFGLDENFEPQPQMVDTWEVSEDGLEWSFTLRPGQKWHDGTDVTAADCVASLTRWGARDGIGQALFAEITEIKAVDDATFTISLSRPYPQMTDTLAKLSSNVPFMMPRRIAETDPNVPITDPTGSGPFIFSLDDWVPGEKAVYLRNENYVPRDEPTSLAAGGKIAFLDRIEWVSYPDQETAMQALIDNDIQYMESPSIALVPMLEGKEGVSVALADATGSIGMAVFNHEIPPFDNAGVRKAVISAMSQEAYMEAAIGNTDYYKICPSVYACGTTYATPVSDPSFVSSDMDAAKAMLAESGYDGTPVIVLDPVDSPVISAFTGVTLDVLKELGMTVDHQQIAWADLIERRANRGTDPQQAWNMFHTWWIAEDLSDPLRIAYSGDPEKGWIGWPNDPELGALRTAFLVSEDDAERADLAKQVQDRIVAQGNFAVLGQFFEPIAFRSSVLGLQRPIQMYYNLAIDAP
ncbi:MAG: ABC transporter substrate-binding protein [Rhodobacteraceae bacterium]|nr:ABC transporter substrate-binding protein [Paracoccaceae bacterium]